MRIKLLLLINVYSIVLGSTNQEQAVIDKMVASCKSQYNYDAITQQATTLAPMIQQVLTDIVQNNYNFTGAINYLHAINGPTNNTTSTTSLYSFAAQKDTKGSYYCPSYNFEILLPSIKSFNCKSCTSCQTAIVNLITDLFTLNGSQCQVQCGSAGCSATNNLAYQVNPSNGYIYNAANSTGLFQSVMSGQLCDMQGNYYVPVGCQCSGFDLSLDQINNASSYLFGPLNTAGNTSIIMECPICQYFYQASNVLALTKYQALDFIYQQLQNTTVASAVKTYCTANPTVAGCNQYATMRQPLMPQSRNLAIPWQYNINAKNQCNAAGSGPENQISENYCLLIDLNKLYQLQDVFNLLNVIAQSVQLLWKTTQTQLTTLQNEMTTCVTDQEKQEELQLQISTLSEKQQILNEQQELVNQQGPLNSLKTLNQKLGLANNILNVGMMSYQLLMPKAIQEAISKGYSELLTSIKNGLVEGFQNLSQDLSRNLESLVQAKVTGTLETSIATEADTVVADVGSQASEATKSVVQGTLTQVTEVATQAAEQAGADAAEVATEVEVVAESAEDMLSAA